MSLLSSTPLRTLLNTYEVPTSEWTSLIHRIQDSKIYQFCSKLFMQFAGDDAIYGTLTVAYNNIDVIPMEDPRIIKIINLLQEAESELKDAEVSRKDPYCTDFILDLVENCGLYSNPTGIARREKASKFSLSARDAKFILDYASKCETVLHRRTKCFRVLLDEMVSFKKVADKVLIAIHCVVLGAYLIKKVDYMEFYFDLKMHQCHTDQAKIEQLEKWDDNHKFDIPPGISQEEWRTFWFMFRETAYLKYNFLFDETYTPPALRNDLIVLTDGGHTIMVSIPSP
ncbi:unnamed protein product [Caenorhabditis sp. 36 PRJEB53466]|nr:unnamed protein product [Caenorhabditis sp. 36 PRJEB53466]